MGNYLLGFKKNKLYVINVSSTSDAGWYLEGEYHGMGCLSQESIVKTPFGICWVNNDGTYIFDGQTAPKELTFKLDDKTWRTNQLLKVPSIGYDNNFLRLSIPYLLTFHHFTPIQTYFRHFQEYPWFSGRNPSILNWK